MSYMLDGKITGGKQLRYVNGQDRKFAFRLCQDYQWSCCLRSMNAQQQEYVRNKTKL